MNEMTEALKGQLGGAAMENARLTALAMRLRAALVSGDGRDAVLRESEFLASPEQAAPVVRDNTQQAFEDAVLTGTGWMRTPTPSAETIDTPELLPLPEPTIEGSVMHDELKICYRAPVHFTAEQMQAYARAHIAHIDARMAAARQESHKNGFDFGYKLGKDEAQAAAPVVAPSLDLRNVTRIERFSDQAVAVRLTSCRAASQFALELDALRNSAATPTPSAETISTHPAPAAGLTDMPLRDRILKCSPGLRLAEIDALEAVFRDYAQQPAQAVAKDEKQGGLVEQIKQQVMARLAHRGLLSDLSHNGVRIIGYELLSDVERVVAEFGIEPLCQQAAIKAMVERFLGWPIPKSFSPDCGISFDGRKDDQWNKNKPWPIGTNLLNADEARQMFEYVLQGAAPLATHEGKAGDGDELRANVEYLLNSYPGTIRVMEGGGPENLSASLAVTFIKLRDAAMQAQQAGKAGA